mmetsp:Transcript_29369/g.87042  ORF Transcript_29369/g.87042 Transcript_29369/m.87042 type:complete len:322 (-) Transcript_29369:1428-2393(-)
MAVAAPLRVELRRSLGRTDGRSFHPTQRYADRRSVVKSLVDALGRTHRSTVDFGHAVVVVRTQRYSHWIGSAQRFVLPDRCTVVAKVRCAVVVSHERSVPGSKRYAVGISVVGPYVRPVPLAERDAFDVDATVLDGRAQHPSHLVVEAQFVGRAVERSVLVRIGSSQRRAERRAVVSSVGGSVLRTIGHSERDAFGGTVGDSQRFSLPNSIRVPFVDAIVCSIVGPIVRPIARAVRRSVAISELVVPTVGIDDSVQCPNGVRGSVGDFPTVIPSVVFSERLPQQHSVRIHPTLIGGDECAEHVVRAFYFYDPVGISFLAPV